MQTQKQKAAKFAAKHLLSHPSSDLPKLKSTLAKKYKISILKNTEILSAAPTLAARKKLLPILQLRPMRTGSGVSPVAIMPKPFTCVGRCTYCPQGENAPKSYTGFEPATMRAIENHYDPRAQIESRLSQYAALGHPTDKCEVILMGGTFLAVPRHYRHEFLLGTFEAFNSPKIKKQKTPPKQIDPRTQEKYSPPIARNIANSLSKYEKMPLEKLDKLLVAAQKKNESSRHRIIGMTFETRPDWCTQKDIDETLFLGGTRVELGVQTLQDEILDRVKRGHRMDAVYRATMDLRNSSFKIGYHMMPGLYGTKKSNTQNLIDIFTDSRLMPDMLKIYPCLVVPGTGLYEEWKAGKFTPLTTDEAIQLIADATPHFPEWVRVMRMQRDIPAPKIAAGVKNGNLHQLVLRELASRGQKCRCIRCREVFSPYRKESESQKSKMAAKKQTPKPLALEMVKRQYVAADGQEHFISFEDVEADLLAGFIRLRFPPFSHRPEINVQTALIRELHVYGSEFAIGAEKIQTKNANVQHQGIGKKLLQEAENMSRDAGKSKMLIISGIGTRNYYRKLGYERDGPYMGKNL